MPAPAPSHLWGRSSELGECAANLFHGSVRLSEAVQNAAIVWCSQCHCFRHRRANLRFGELLLKTQAILVNRHFLNPVINAERTEPACEGRAGSSRDTPFRPNPSCLHPIRRGEVAEGTSMRCNVRANRHADLAFQLRWNGLASWEGTRLRDTAPNRARLERAGRLID